MNTSPDRALLDWLADGPDRGPSDGLERVFAVTRHTRKRPRWTFPERWLPMQLTAERGSVPRGAFRLLLFAILLAILAVAALWVGSQRTDSPIFGQQTNGLIVYGADGQLFAVDPDGTNQRPFLPEIQPAEAASFSPDGTKVAFWRPMIGGNYLWVADIDGDNLRQLGGEAHSQHGIPLPAEWSPDGRELVYSTLTAVYRVTVDGSTEQLLGLGHGPEWSPDGQLIAFRRALSQNAELVFVRPDGAEVSTLESPDREAFHAISWSPDSRRVAVDHDGIVTLVGPGVPEQQISRTGEFSMVPAWSPDGRTIAYLTVPEKGRAELRLVDIASGGITASTMELGDCPWPIWSPDSTQLLAWAADSECWDMVIIPVANPAAARPLDIPTNVGSGPHWQGVPKP
jgi:WD40 repeat protein